MGQKMSTLRVGAVCILFLMVNGACGGSNEAPTVDTVASKGERIHRDAIATAAEKLVTLEEFRARNPLSYVGTAHNAGLAEFFRSYTNENRRQPCAALLAAWRAARRSVGPDSANISESSSTLMAGLSSSGLLRCSAPPRAVNFVAPAMPVEMSGDPQPYFDAIDAIVASEPPTSSYISQVAAVVASAEAVLSGAELDQVYAVASVAVESHDYWVVNNGLAATSDSLELVYGNCLTLADEPQTCFYDAAASSSRAPSLFSYASYVPRQGIAYCAATHFKAWKVVAKDVVGAFIGVLVGNPAAGALAASVEEAADQAINFLVCVFAS